MLKTEVTVLDRLRELGAWDSGRDMVKEFAYYYDDVARSTPRRCVVDLADLFCGERCRKVHVEVDSGIAPRKCGRRGSDLRLGHRVLLDDGGSTNKDWIALAWIKLRA